MGNESHPAGAGARPFPLEPTPIHVSERAHELGKNYRTDLAVHANVKETLKALNEAFEAAEPESDVPRAIDHLPELVARHGERERGRRWCILRAEWAASVPVASPSAGACAAWATSTVRVGAC